MPFGLLYKYQCFAVAWCNHLQGILEKLFYVRVTVDRNKFLYNKTNQMH